LLQKHYEIAQNVHSPRFSLNPFELQLIPERDLLLKELDLTLNFKSPLSRKTISFEKEFIYDNKSLRKFRKNVLRRDGYLENESNYFNVKDDLFSEGTKCTILKNSRVILFTRNVLLPESSIQTILTAGLLLLVGESSREELASFIRNKLPDGQFEVSIRYEQNTYVLIGIERPIFSF
jgi:hypothetical protein